MTVCTAIPISNHRTDFMNSVTFVCNNFESVSDNVRKNVLLLYGDSCFDGFKNRFTLEATVTYIKTSERFSESLFD